MKYYIIAGEASGDLHASNLIKELRLLDNNVDFRCWGGYLMEEQGAKIIKHYNELAFMGFLEVIINLRKILRNMAFCKKDILEYNPDVVILVDYPGFNLRIAQFLQRKGYKIFYYISPQVWAWKSSRVHKIKRVVDKMFVILPFEEKFYAKYNYKVDYVGHPLLDAIHNRKKISRDQFLQKNKLDQLPIIAVLPGSRKQEIIRMLPVMLSIKENFKNYQFVIAAAPGLPEKLYLDIIGKTRKNVFLVQNQTYDLLDQASAAMVTSGTATLETALFGVPEVVCYSGNILSYYIARLLVKVRFISLVNLIMNKEIVKELIQQEFTPDNLILELNNLLDIEKKEEINTNYNNLRIILGGNGASKKTAGLMANYLGLSN